jgi:DNA repair protein RadD
MIATLPRPTKILPKVALRSDQARAIADVYAEWQQDKANVLCVASTGFGKTFTAAKIMLDFFNSPNKSGELWFCIHRISLVRSSIKAAIAMGVPAEELTYYWADSVAPIQGVEAGRMEARIKIVMLPTLTSWLKPGSGNEAYAPTEQIRLLILDEAHITSRSDIGMWLMERSAKVLGLTATPSLDSPWESMGRDFHRCVLTTSHAELVRRGDLRRFEYMRLGADLFVEGALSQSGEEEELARLGKQLLKPEVMTAVINSVEREAKKYARKNNGVRKVAVFAPSQESAIALAEEWGRRLGVGRVAYILSQGCQVIGTEQSDRTKIETSYGDVESGLDILISVSAIAVGFDQPSTSIIVLLRKFSSLAMFIQSLGRGCRKFALCSYSLCIDFLNNLRSASNPNGFAPVEELVWDAEEILRERERPDAQEAPTKKCPECDRLMFATAKICREEDGGCGYVFETDEGGEADPVALAKLKLERLLTPTYVVMGGASLAGGDGSGDRFIEAVRLKWGQCFQAAIYDTKARPNPYGKDPMPNFVAWLNEFARALRKLEPGFEIPADLISHKYLGGCMMPKNGKWRDSKRIFKLSIAISRIEGNGAWSAYWRLAAIEFGAEALQAQHDADDWAEEDGVIRRQTFREAWGRVKVRLEMTTKFS